MSGCKDKPKFLLSEFLEKDLILGLPQLELPKDNPITKEKVLLGEKLFTDSRFSSTGKVSCSTCHLQERGFTDSPLKTSEGIDKKTGTRNAPTIINAAYNLTQFWDGRSPDLEDQALHPFVNPVEMGLKDHNPILKIVRSDPEYIKAFKNVFDIPPEKITITHVVKSIAAFERVIISSNSRFDRWYFKGEDVLTSQEKKGFDIFVNKGRCLSCHVVEYTTALFTDGKFHNVGVGINNVSEEDIARLSKEFLNADYNKETVDQKVLADLKTSELGRFAVTRNLSELGAFKTPTLRDIALTSPYMHDGSLKTLEEVVDHYNRGGASSDNEKINPYLSGGIRPLNLSADEKRSLVAFLKTMTGKKFEKFL
ncbi:MAG: cytochrome-c peroxidase [Spirochaetae bacterium HGW-Spirochaetae-1]|nr:MAG: cytochrome-c peroxidase [Spirochaetae bacterium HGW-Spirochaetae-1]